MNIMTILQRLFGGKKKKDYTQSKIMKRRSAVYNLYFVEGITQLKIAEILDIGIRTIERDVKYLKKKSPLPTSKPVQIIARRTLAKSIKDLTKEDIKTIKKLRLEGKKLHEIATMTGATPTIVSYALDREKYHTRYIQRKYRKEHKFETIRKIHAVKMPRYYHELCPACNPSSPITWQMWIRLQQLVKVSKLNHTEFNLQTFLAQNKVETNTSTIKIIEGMGMFSPATKVEFLQRPTEEPKGGYVL